MKNWVVGASLVAAVICGLRLWMPASDAAAGETQASGASGADPNRAFLELSNNVDATGSDGPRKGSVDGEEPQAQTVFSSELDDALAAYRRGEHREAAKRLAPLVEQGIGLPASRVFLAAAALESGDFTTARQAAQRAAAHAEAPSWRIEAEALLMHCDLRDGQRSRTALSEEARARLTDFASSPSGRLFLQELVDRSIQDGAAPEGMRMAQTAIEHVARSLEGKAGHPRVRGLADALDRAQLACLRNLDSTLWAGRAVVGQGEPLARVVRRLRTEGVGGLYDAHFLAWANGITNPGRVNAGRKLLVPSGDLAIEVFRGSRLVLVYCGELLVRVHGCAIGRQEKPTPTGSFEIGEKIEHPVWHGPGRPVAYGDPKNPLGEGWLGFVDRPDATGYGLHGTNDEGSIGTEASEGCVRLYNAAIVELMNWVAPKGTQVTIH